jgi:UDP-N-acetylmuramate--alanine ligase
MSALALAARRRGVAVSGCDTDVGAFDDLAAVGITTHPAPDVQHPVGCRALVVTAAARTDHPEIVAAREHGVPVVPRKEALAELVNAGTLAAISGTHGKTTTTVMTTLALRAAGLRASGLAGGRVAAWGGNALLDDEPLFVVEADEYDQAFLTLMPTIAVVNNVEADHLECYGSVEAMEDAFVTFASRATRCFVGTADAGSARVAARLGAAAVRFGVEPEAEVRITVQRADAEGSEALITFPSGASCTLRLSVPGLHNLRNATAALAVTEALGGSLAAATAALAEFTGVGRRFERLGEADGITFVDDYAHHPTELEATLRAARQAFPDRRLVAAFQPHLFSRTREHGEAMGRLLAAADLVIIADVYAAREAPMPGVTGKLVADAAMAAGAMVAYEPRRERLAAEVGALLRDGDVLLTMGAGDITLVGRELLARAVGGGV